MRRTKNQTIQILLLLMMLTLAGTALAIGVSQPEVESTGYSQADLVLLIVYVLLALVFSFLCSVAEAVLLSITPSFIAGLQEKSPKKAALLKELKQDNVDRSLAAILTLNTIAHTVGAIGSGSKATAVFGSAWFGVFSAVMTLMILFLSEIVPKTIGAVFWRGLSGITARFVKTLVFLLYPLIFVSEKLTKLVSGGHNVHLFSRDEFVAMAGIGEESGHIKARESRIIRNLFLFESLKAKDIMTPRTVIVGLKCGSTVYDALEAKTGTTFSRLPVYGDSMDDIQGFVLRADLLLAAAQDKDSMLIGELKREIRHVREDLFLSELLEYLLDERQHIVLLSDEYGGTVGLVTLEDVIETLLGMEIVDELDKVKDMQALARRQWAKRAKALGLDIEALNGNENDDSDPTTEGQNNRG